MRISIDSLRLRLAEIEKERELLLHLMEFYNSMPKNSINKNEIEQPTLFGDKPSKSMSDTVIEIVVAMSKDLGRSIHSSEIMDFLLNRGIVFSDSKNPDRLLSAILSNELKKKNPRIVRTDRGFYEGK